MPEISTGIPPHPLSTFLEKKKSEAKYLKKSFSLEITQTVNYTLPTK